MASTYGAGSNPKSKVPSPVWDDVTTGSIRPALASAAAQPRPADAERTVARLSFVTRRRGNFIAASMSGCGPGGSRPPLLVAKSRAILRQEKTEMAGIRGRTTLRNSQSWLEGPCRSATDESQPRPSTLKALCSTAHQDHQR